MTEQGALYDNIGRKYDDYSRTATCKRAERYSYLNPVSHLTLPARNSALASRTSWSMGLRSRAIHRKSKQINKGDVQFIQALELDKLFLAAAGCEQIM